MAVFLVLVLYCLITSPLLIIVLAASGGAAYIAGLKNAERKLSIAGEDLSTFDYESLDFPHKCGELRTDLTLDTD